MSFRISSNRDPSEYFTQWRPLWIGVIDNFWEHFIGLETSTLWRRHSIWSKKNGRDLREGLVQRFSSITIFLSVIVAAEIGVITSPSKPVENVRIALANNDLNSFEFWTGVALSMATYASIAALMANYSAWAVFDSVSEENLKLIARSSIGIYAAQLPNRLLIFVNYLFLAWIVLFWYILMPAAAAICLSIGAGIFFIYVVSGNSALANIIMKSGAMSDERMVEAHLESQMSSSEISAELLRRKRRRQAVKTPVNESYRTTTEPSTLRRRAPAEQATRSSSGSFIGDEKRITDHCNS